ncbi:hypothetical protein AgCh_012332 [Apium graveolens]
MEKEINSSDDDRGSWYEDSFNYDKTDDDAEFEDYVDPNDGNNYNGAYGETGDGGRNECKNIKVGGANVSRNTSGDIGDDLKNDYSSDYGSNGDEQITADSEDEDQEKKNILEFMRVWSWSIFISCLVCYFLMLLY